MTPLQIPSKELQGLDPEVLDIMNQSRLDEAESFGDIIPSSIDALKIGGRAALTTIKKTVNPLQWLNAVTGGSARKTAMSGFEAEYFSKDSKGNIIITNPDVKLDNLKAWGDGGLMATKSGKYPLVFFHASPKFVGNQLDMTLSQSRDSGWLGQGGYLTTRYDRDSLDQYTRFKGKEGEAPDITPLFVKMKKPLELTRDKSEVGWGAYKMNPVDRNIIQNKLINLKLDFDNIKEGEEVAEAIQREAEYLNNITHFKPEDIEEYLERAGYTPKDMSVPEFLQSSGLGYDGVIIREPENPDDIPEAVIFDAKQAKSVFNRGFFNPDSADLHSNIQNNRKMDSQIPV